VKKYRILREMAAQRQVESLTFFKGEIPIFCDNCPIKNSLNFCRIVDDINDIIDNEMMRLACHGAFIRFLFSKEV
jgi:hypothetical protein